MPRIDLTSVTAWITVAAQQHGDALANLVAERLGVTRRSAQLLISKLIAAQWLRNEGTRRRPRYRPGALKQVVQRYPLTGLQEDLPWAGDFAPFFDLSQNVTRLAQHAFTELVNNAVDHSGGGSVTVSMRQTPLHLQLLVSDDGCGIFNRLQQSFDIDNPALAMLELSKGKLTSQPERHLGHGLFFTPRLADMFDLHANQAAFQFRGSNHRCWVAGKPMARRGTSIYLGIALDTERTLDEVLRSHSADARGYGFDTTAVPLALMTDARSGLESRAQARRAMVRLGDFRRAELDFSGIPDLGHGFADEIFRVYARAHPGVELQPVGMAPRVAEMVAIARDAAARAQPA